MSKNYKLVISRRYLRNVNATLTYIRRLLRFKQCLYSVRLQ